LNLSFGVAFWWQGIEQTFNTISFSRVVKLVRPIQMHHQCLRAFGVITKTMKLALPSQIQLRIAQNKKLN
jgi:hypothetical protein